MPDAPPTAAPKLLPLVGGEAVTMVGGSADEARLAELLGWLGSVPAANGSRPRWWRSLESTGSMVLEEGPPEPPEAPDRLVWGRWFGAAGDLEAWRDGERFRWRFVGEGGARPALGEGDSDAFVGDPGLRVRAVARTARLWARDEARIATADGATTLKLLGERTAPAILTYVEYLDAGSVAAVRYVEVLDGTETRTDAEEVAHA